MRRLAALALAFATAALPSLAQTPPPGPAIDAKALAPVDLTPVAQDGESTVVEELEVIARAKGPALWTVRRGDAQVTIIGGYAPLPHSLEWDKARLERVLAGASAFYEAKASLNPWEMAGLLFTAGRLKLDGGRTLDEVIGPERRARLRALLATNHADLDKMQPFKPAVAGVLAYQTFVRTVGWSNEKPATTIRRMVRQHGLQSGALARLAAPAVIRSIEAMPMPQQLACFDATLDQTEQESAHGLEAARAWAEGRMGDLNRLRSHAILDRCLADSGGGRAVLEKAITDAADSIDGLLRKPGKTVALLSIDVLLPRNGVLDRLRARGAQITLPPD